MSNRADLIEELATRIGTLRGEIEIALINFKHNATEAGLKVLREALQREMGDGYESP